MFLSRLVAGTQKTSPEQGKLYLRLTPITKWDNLSYKEIGPCKASVPALLAGETNRNDAKLGSTRYTKNACKLAVIHCSKKQLLLTKPPLASASLARI